MRAASQLALAPKSFSVASLLLHVRLLQLLLTLLTPFRSIVAWQLLCGRSLLSILNILKRAVFHVVGWLSSRSESKTLNRVLYPILDLRRWHVVAAAILLYSAISSALRAWRDSNDDNEQQRRRLRAAMVSSRSYFEWSINAAKLDALDGTDQEHRWRMETRLYDRRLLEDKVAHLRSVRSDSGSSVAEQMFAVRADLLRNLGNITNSALHEHFPVVPVAIREYIDEVKQQLQDIACSPDVPVDERTAFLKETRHAFGRTALVLFGGGPLGAFHLGVVKALLEHRLLPRVLAGTSTGAIVAAIAATRDDEALGEFIAALPQMDLRFFGSSASALDFLASKVAGGGNTAGKRSSSVVHRLRRLLGDTTFLQAYAHTGRVLNVSVVAADSAEPPRLLNYLTSPDVLVWSAVAAAAGLTGAARPSALVAKDAKGRVVDFLTSQTGAAADGFATASSGGGGRWRKGDAAEDLPLRGLSETFSVNHTIVSQTDLQLVPLLNLKRQMGTAGQLAEAEVKHRCYQVLEMLPPSARSGWLRRLAQPWEGDVTIVPSNAVLQLQKALLGPSQRDLLEAVRAGELATWAKLSAIQCNCGIEACLDACIQQTCAWSRTERRGRKFDVSKPLKQVRVASFGKVDAADTALCDMDDEMMGPFSPSDAVLLLPYESKSGNAFRKGARGPSPLFTPCSAFECTDDSANLVWAEYNATKATGKSGALRGSEALEPAVARRSLDVIAP